MTMHRSRIPGHDVSDHRRGRASRDSRCSWAAALLGLAAGCVSGFNPVVLPRDASVDAGDAAGPNADAATTDLAGDVPAATDAPRDDVPAAMDAATDAPRDDVPAAMDAATDAPRDDVPAATDAATCATGLTFCAGVGCVNTATDPDRCGACDRACGAGENCRSGACVCPAGLTRCGAGATAACTNTSTDAANCGSCGRTCEGSFPNALATCAAATCVQVACRSGFGDCNASPGCETDLATSAAACGRCGNVCTAPAGRTALCAMGACGVGGTCATPLADCDGVAGNGCEANLTSDVANCGACGVACAFANAAASCASGACAMGSCLPGFANCDGSSINGCEVNLNSDVANCGACARLCTFSHAGATCAASTCRITACAAGYQDCNANPSDGCEVSLNTSDANCGACEFACPSGLHCAAGSCCPAGQGLCTNTCVDFSSNTNCGACGRVCACGAGSCMTTGEIATTNSSVCARLSNGTVRCWGSDEVGALGRGAPAGGASLSPGPVTGLSGVARIASNRQNSTSGVNSTGFYLALLDDRTVRAWGSGGWGQLGDGRGVESNAPVTVSGLSDVAQVVAGQIHACARRTDGTVRCWGRGAEGQCGNGLGRTSENTPVAVTGITTAVEIGISGSISCARLGDGTVRCWGNGSLAPTSVPGISDAIALVTAPYASHVCALLRDETVNCWGQGSASGATGLTGVVEVAVGVSFTCARVTDGRVLCLGANGNGQLGDGTTTTRNTPAPVTGIVDAVEIAAAGIHACARLRGGTVRCWGYTEAGQGDGTTVLQHSTPVAVTGIGNAAQLLLGAEGDCVRLVDGSLRCWGRNSRGEVGDGTNTQRTAPVTVRWP